MFYGDYRDYNLDRHNEQVCDALDRSSEYPPDDEDEGDEEDVRPTRSPRRYPRNYTFPQDFDED